MESNHHILNPYTGQSVRTVKLISAAEMDSALDLSAGAFAQARKTPAYKRAELLRALAAGIAEDAERFALAIMREAGKPIAMARVEAQRAIATLSGSAEEATRLGGETLALDTAPTGAGRTGITRRFPVGPVAAISPFNFPLNLGMHKVGPALASGNSVLWKPPLQAPGAAILFGELFDRVARELKFPADALQVLVCQDSVAESLASDPRTRMLSFTGSSRVGWLLRAKAGTKKVTLELGGNAAVIVAPDADLDFAAKRCAEGGYGYAGQVCIAVQRVLVHDSIYDEFRAKMLSAVGALMVGDPADSATQVGPMVSAKEADRVELWTTEAVDSGAKLLCGGKRDGLMFEPALFEEVTPTMRIVSAEVFGPVVTLERYSQWGEALAMVNDSVYGLQTGIFTNDLANVLAAFENLEVGAVIVGDIPTLRIDSMPYGGVKESGLGREGMRYAIEEMTEQRLLVLPHARD